MNVTRVDLAVFGSAILAVSLVVSFPDTFAQREAVSAQTELNLVVHEDASVTVYKCDAEECNKIKGFANVEALAGSNGLVDLIEQLELWK